MMKFDNRILMLVGILALNMTLFSQEAQEEAPKYGWKNSAVGNLNFNQTSFSNWVQGGENSWSWLLNFAARFIYQKERLNWENSLKLEYGQSKVGDDDSKKSADEIFLETLLAYDLNQALQLYGSANGRTQFAEGFDFKTDPKTRISKFMNPGYFIESVGLRYKPWENFSSRLGVAAKQTVVTDEEFAPRYTDKSATGELEKVRQEIGLESVSVYDTQLAENLVFSTNLELFSNLEAFNQIDVRWDNILKADIIKYVAVSFTFQLFYDRDIDIKRQLKQVLGVGLTYTFL